MTYTRDRPNELAPWLQEHNVPILTNALHRWSENTDRFMDMWEYDTDHVIDAGGYNVQSHFADRWGNLKVDDSTLIDEKFSDEPFYPWTVDQYHEFLSTHSDEFEWATVMDYACEERFDSLWSVDSRVEATVENTINHFNKDPDYKVLPVLQGRSIEDYERSYDMLNDHGIPTNHVGLGTVCRLSSTKEIINFENKIRNTLDVDDIHGFGVKVDSFTRGAEFETADSAAWVYGASHGRIQLLERKNNGDLRMREEKSNDSLIRTVESFKTYYAYVTWLKSGTPAIDVEPLFEFADQFDDTMTRDEYKDRWV